MARLGFLLMNFLHAPRWQKFPPRDHKLNLDPDPYRVLERDDVMVESGLTTRSVHQNPNALDTKVLSDLDHVKKGLKIDDEELKKMESDPAYNINVSGDIKQMLAELGTEKGRQTALHGGGGSKAQKERAGALAALSAARS